MINEETLTKLTNHRKSIDKHINLLRNSFKLEDEDPMIIAIMNVVNSIGDYYKIIICELEKDMFDLENGTINMKIAAICGAAEKVHSLVGLLHDKLNVYSWDHDQGEEYDYDRIKEMIEERDNMIKHIEIYNNLLKI